MDIKKLGRIDEILIELMEHLIDEDLQIAGEARGLINEIASVKNNDCIADVSNSDLIDYIENDAEVAMPIDELMHEDGRHLTKKEYGKVLLKYLVKELRSHYC